MPLIERLRSVILEKGRAKVRCGVLLLHGNAPIHKCNIVQAAIQQAGFIELNQLAYSPDIAPSDYHLFSNLKKFLRLKNFSSDDEAVTTIEDYLTGLNSEPFCKGIQVCMTAGSLWFLVKVSKVAEIQNFSKILFLLFFHMVR